MKSWKSFKSLFLFYLFFLSSVCLAAERQSAVVDIALTGDTIRLKGGKILKYNGIECYSPESKIGLSKTYGTQAHEFNQKLIAGKKIEIEWGPKLRDKNNRLLGYVFTEDGLFVNEELLKNGYAKARIIAPNTHYADEFKSLESLAKRNKKGIWEKEPDDGGTQKKLVGEKNTKIYYLPDSPELDHIPQAQLVYFDSRVNAKAAGYTACFTCRQKGELDESE